MARKLYLKSVAGLLGSFVLACATAHAQTGQTGGSQTGGGTTGGTQTGGSTGSTGQTGGTNTGSTNTGSTGGGTTGTGQPFGASFDPTRFGQSATGAGTRSSGSAAGGGTRGTIGGRTNTSTAGRSGLGAASLNASGGAGRGGLSGQQTNRQTEQRAQYATRIDFGSAVPGEPLRSTTELRSTVQQSLAAVVPSGITATVDGSKVILKGTVASESDRKLAERIVLLEPGVRSVQNELIVQGRSSSVQ